MFQFRRFPSLPYLIQARIHGLFPCVFPHSEIHGSTVICTFPWLIAACRVLLRLLMPRHPSCALSSLTLSIANSQLKLYGNLGFAKLLEHFCSLTLCFPEKPSNLLKSFPICCFLFFVFSLQFSMCWLRKCFALSKLNNTNGRWSLSDQDDLGPLGPGWSP